MKIQFMVKIQYESQHGKVLNHVALVKAKDHSDAEAKGRDIVKGFTDFYEILESKAAILCEVQTTAPDPIREKAAKTVEALRQKYAGNKTELDFYCSQFIAGNHNKQLRREVMYLATGEMKPVKDCGLFAVCNALKARFDQYSLF